jgi:FdhD protein
MPHEQQDSDNLARLILHFLAQAVTNEAVALARIGKRFNVSQSTLMRQLHMMSSAAIMGYPGAGWVTLDIADTDRATVTLTEAGRKAAQHMATAISLTAIKRYQVGAENSVTDQISAQDFVSNEQAIALVFNGISHAVMMATPSDLEAFALGFSLSEGIVDSIADWRGAEIMPASPEGIEIQIEISPRCFERLKAKRRSLIGATGCGLCGVESLAALSLHLGQEEIISTADWVRGLDANIICKAVAALPQLQHHNSATGSLHAAALAMPKGQLTVVMEDVGRHNALDKLLGTMALQAQQHTSGFVVMSSRASVELVRKCVRLQVPALAVISAPTSLAIALAQRTNLQLWGMCRPPAAVRYN